VSPLGGVRNAATVISRSGMETTVAELSALPTHIASHVSGMKEKLQMLFSMKTATQPPNLQNESATAK